MTEKRPTRHRWSRFSLRTMLVLVTLLCVYLGWLMNWKRQREAVLLNSHNRAPLIGEYFVEEGQQPPFPLAFFFVKGIRVVIPGPSARDEEFKRLQSLFPEAKVYHFEDAVWEVK